MGVGLQAKVQDLGHQRKQTSPGWFASSFSIPSCPTTMSESSEAWNHILVNVFL